MPILCRFEILLFEPISDSVSLDFHDRVNELPRKCGCNASNSAINLIRFSSIGSMGLASVGDGALVSLAVFPFCTRKI